MEENQVHKQVDVNVSRVGDECLVTPGDIVVKPGDIISFTNGTAGHLHIQFADHNVHQETITVPPGKTTYEVRVTPGLRGCFPFAVFCQEVHDFAIGGSMPIVIIVRG